MQRHAQLVSSSRPRCARCRCRGEIALGGRDVERVEQLHINRPARKGCSRPPTVRLERTTASGWQRSRSEQARQWSSLSGGGKTATGQKLANGCYGRLGFDGPQIGVDGNNPPAARSRVVQRPFRHRHARTFLPGTAPAPPVAGRRRRRYRLSCFASRVCTPPGKARRPAGTRPHPPCRPAPGGRRNSGKARSTRSPSRTSRRDRSTRLCKAWPRWVNRFSSNTCSTWIKAHWRGQ
jgi:hypothetical protein